MSDQTKKDNPWQEAVDRMVDKMTKDNDSIYKYMFPNTLKGQQQAGAAKSYGTSNTKIQLPNGYITWPEVGDANESGDDDYKSPWISNEWTGFRPHWLTEQPKIEEAKCSCGTFKVYGNVNLDMHQDYCDLRNKNEKK